MSDSDNAYIDMQNDAIFHGTVFPPDRKGISDAITLPFHKIKFLRNVKARGPIYSKRAFFAWIIPFILSFTVFFLAHVILPSSTPIIGDWFWSFIGLPVISSIILRMIFGQISGYDELMAHLGSYSFTSKWMLLAALPERLWRWDFSHVRVQLITLLSCHPSRTAGRAGSEYEPVPAMILYGLRPLANFPINDDPANNDVIVNPEACRNLQLHPPETVNQRTDDEGVALPLTIEYDFDEVADQEHYRDLAYMRNRGHKDAVMTTVADPEELLGGGIRDYGEEYRRD